MPVRKRIQLKANKQSKLTPGLQFCFLVDADPMGELGVGLSDAEIQSKLAELWKIHGAEFLERFTAEQPGQRPNIWWRLDSPEPRPQIAWVGGSPGGDPYQADRALRRARELEILTRHGLLAPKERKFVETNPGLLLPLEHDLGGG